MAKALLALGSNLGCREKNLAQAIEALTDTGDLRLLARSRWLRTDPIGGPEGQDSFLNGCVLVQTSLAAIDLALAMHAVEEQLGRKREVQWGPRNIDIDLLLYDQQIIHGSSLIVPHPRMNFRRFVLEPACEIAGYLVHPTSGWTISGLLGHLLHKPRLVAITGDDSALGKRLASELRVRIDMGNGDRLANLSGAPPKGSQQGPQANKPKIEYFPPHTVFSGELIPTLVISWEPTSEDGVASPQVVSDRMQWRGPLAVLGGCNFETVVEESIASITAAWPDLVVNPN